ncbi:MAG: YitT family protein [Coprococcus sp.]
MQKNISKTLHNFLIISLGNLIYTVAVAFFILPNNLITGGTTGLALFGQYMFHIPITAFVYVFNIAMFLLGAWVLGKAFALTTILSTFEYPFFLSILAAAAPAVSPLTQTTGRLPPFSPVQVSVSDPKLRYVRPVHSTGVYGYSTPCH